MSEYTPQTQKNPPTGGAQGDQKLTKVALALAIVAVILAVIALVLILRNHTGLLLPPEPVTFQYGGQTLTAVEGVPVNYYDDEGFSVQENGRVTYRQNGHTAKTGIDVSIYQNEIDWQAVAADGIDFAIIRLGYRGYGTGGLMMDDRFTQNIKGALDAGLEVGVYFFSQAITPEEAEAEAAFVLNAIKGYQITYPVAFDWEPITEGHGARTDDLSGDILTQCAVAFCREVEKAGYVPAVYINQDLGYLHYDLRDLSEELVWLAEYKHKPNFYYNFHLWQYTHTGAVDGIEGNVDLNLDLRMA